MAISDWSTTASSNGNSDANINWQEGQAPSTVNDSARSMMSRLKHWWNQLGGNITSGGTSNAYTLTSGESLTAYSTGMRFLWKPNAAPTGAATMNVDSIGAKKLFMPDGSQVLSGELDANSFYDIVYDASLDSSSGGFQIIGFEGESLTETHLLASNNLSDVASASTSRTNLGLGTAATANTGTSGATVPLFNGTNTWSGTQTFNSGGSSLDIVRCVGTTPGIRWSETDGAVDEKYWRFYANAGILNIATLNDAESAQGASGLRLIRSGNAIDEVELNGTTIDINGAADFSATPTVGGSDSVWHSGNDGAGSNLDADTLDGMQASEFAQLASNNTFAGNILVSKTSGQPYFDIIRSGTLGTDYPELRLRNSTQYSAVRATTTTLELAFAYTGANKVLAINATGVTYDGIDIVKSGDAVAASSETSGTLTSASANKTIQLAGTITVPNSVFSAGDMIVVYAGASSRTITQGSGLTMRLGGTSTTGSRTLAARGMATIFFVNASECVVSGGAVT